MKQRAVDELAEPLFALHKAWDRTEAVSRVRALEVAPNVQAQLNEDASKVLGQAISAMYRAIDRIAREAREEDGG